MGSILTPTNGGLTIIQISLIVLVILFLAYNVYLYFCKGTDILQKFFWNYIIQNRKVR